MYSDSARVSAQGEAARAEPEGLALGPAIERLLFVPLTALRVSLEGLETELSGESLDRVRAVHGQICALTRDVDSLIDLAAPRRVWPLPCSIEELASSALALISDRDRARIVVDLPALPCSLEIDGTLFTACLGRVLMTLLSRKPERVAMQAFRHGQRTVFRLVEDRGQTNGPPHDVDGPAPALPINRATSLALALQLAQRDITRMGGEFSVEYANDGSLRVVLSFSGEGGQK